MKRSDFTTDLNVRRWVLTVIDWIILLTPIIVYFFIGLCGDGVIVKKVTLVCTMVVALCLAIFNIIAKKHLRSVLWIMVLGIYVACENILPMIMILAVATILDEFLFTPLIERYKTQYLASKTDDEKREWIKKKTRRTKGADPKHPD